MKYFTGTMKIFSIIHKFASLGIGLLKSDYVKIGVAQILEKISNFLIAAYALDVLLGEELFQYSLFLSLSSGITSILTIGMTTLILKNYSTSKSNFSMSFMKRSIYFTFVAITASLLVITQSNFNLQSHYSHYIITVLLVLLLISIFLESNWSLYLTLLRSRLEIRTIFIISTLRGVLKIFLTLYLWGYEFKLTLIPIISWTIFIHSAINLVLIYLVSQMQKSRSNFDEKISKKNIISISRFVKNEIYFVTLMNFFYLLYSLVDRMLIKINNFEIFFTTYYKYLLLSTGISILYSAINFIEAAKVSQQKENCENINKSIIRVSKIFLKLLPILIFAILPIALFGVSKSNLELLEVDYFWLTIAWFSSVLFGLQLFLAHVMVIRNCCGQVINLIIKASTIMLVMGLFFGKILEWQSILLAQFVSNIYLVQAMYSKLNLGKNLVARTKLNLAGFCLLSIITGVMTITFEKFLIQSNAFNAVILSVVILIFVSIDKTVNKKIRL